MVCAKLRLHLTKAMRILYSDSFSVHREVAHNKYVYGFHRYEHIYTQAIGSGILFATGFIVSSCIGVGVRAAFAITLLGACVWTLLVFLHARSSKGNWVIVGGSTKLVLKVFVCRGKYFSKIRAKFKTQQVPNILEFCAEEVAELYAQRTEIRWSQVKSTFVEWLVVRPDSSAKKEVADFFRSGANCDNGRNRLITLVDGDLHVRWNLTPALSRFLDQLSTHSYRLPRPSPVREKCIDVSHFGSQDEDHQERLVGQLMILGFAPACILLLRRHKQFSTSRSIEYMAKLGKNDGKTGTA